MNSLRRASQELSHALQYIRQLTWGCPVMILRLWQELTQGDVEATSRFTKAAFLLSSTLILFGTFICASELWFTNAPNSALKSSFSKTAIARYGDDFFHQNWNLFAPSPPKVNYHLLVRLRDDKLVETKWFDLTTTLADSLRGNNLSPNEVLYDSVEHEIASATAQSSPFRQVARVALYRTAALLVKDVGIRHSEKFMQIDLIEEPIAAPGSDPRKLLSSKRSQVFDWILIPPVAKDW